MKKHFLSLTFLLLFSLLGPFPLKAQRPLELEYPEIEGFRPTTLTTPLPDYVKYIFYFALGIVGIVAFFFLVKAGLEYIGSAGNPEVQRKAKEQILACFLGIAILLFSHLILSTIQGKKIIFSIFRLPSLPSETLLSPPHTESPDPLMRMRELIKLIRKTVYLLKLAANDFRPLFDQCQCPNTRAECDCDWLTCRGIRCFGDPCSNRKEIEKHQRLLVEISDLILGYRNLTIAEREDLWAELDYLIFLELLTREEKEKILRLLEDLANKMKKIAQVTQEQLTPLANLCLSDPCHASCQETSCHDTPGCEPAGCSGPNPCPLAEIERKISEIEQIQEGEIFPITVELLELLRKR